MGKATPRTRKAYADDLRRTCARRPYEAGFDLVAIRQNLVHADVKTTLGYIGEAVIASGRDDPRLYDRMSHPWRASTPHSAPPYSLSHNSAK
jgi:hypothetical protein